MLNAAQLEGVQKRQVIVATAQTLRLRGLDAPEMITRDGQESKKALEKMLRSSSPITIRTAKSDKYDRCLADVFVDGIYVNQELVARDRAVGVGGGAMQ